MELKPGDLVDFSVTVRFKRWTVDEIREGQDGKLVIMRDQPGNTRAFKADRMENVVTHEPR
jgi:hypothetical protein